jgi:H+/Cl- antiporter ClcA
LISNNFKSNGSYASHNRSGWWYLAPILLGIIGGLIAYFVLKKDDPKLAKNCLIVGVVMMVLGFIIGAAVGF